LRFKPPIVRRTYCPLRCNTA